MPSRAARLLLRAAPEPRVAFWRCRGFGLLWCMSKKRKRNNRLALSIQQLELHVLEQLRKAVLSEIALRSDRKSKRKAQRPRKRGVFGTQ